MTDIILSAHQVNFLPYLGFFDKMVKSTVFVLLDDVQFVHTGDLAWMNRNKIRTKDGWQYITVPVFVKGRHGQLLSEVQINDEHNWKRKMLGAFKQNYLKAPFFKTIYDKIEEGINKNFQKLIDLNIYFLDFIINYLHISTKIVLSSGLHIKSTKTQRLVDLCKMFRATKYISGIHGKEYLEMELFKQEGIEVIFQEFKAIEYKQQFDGFIPYLSIIDAMFNLGQDSTGLIGAPSN